MFKFDIHVEVSSDLPIEVLRQFRADCHRAVAAMTAYLKHARPTEESEMIGTSVTADNYQEDA